LLVAGVVLVALATAYLLFFRTPGPARRGEDGEASRRIGVAVFPFRPIAGAGEVAWYGQAVAVFLPLALEEDFDLRVLTPERLHDLFRGTLPPELPGQTELARKGNTDYFLRGEVSGSSKAVTLTASWVETRSGKETNRWVVEGITPETLGRKLDDLHARIRSALRLAARAPSEPRLASIVPVKEGPTRAYLEASALLTSGDPGACLKGLTDALALTDFHLARYLQAYAAAQVGDARTAVVAASPLAKASRPLPTRVALLAPAVLALYQPDNPRKAVAPLELFLARFPDEKFPLTWLGAVELLLTREPERARGHLKAALALDPSNRDIKRLLGQATLEAGHPADAVPLLEGYLQAKPADEKTHLFLADAYRRVGRGEDARRQVEEILSHEPENVPAVELLGNLLLAGNRVQDAQEAYAGLTRSKQPSTRSAGELLVGRILLLQGRFHEATRHYRNAVDLADKSGDRAGQARNLLALGELDASLGRNDEALSTLAKVRGINGGIDPDLPMINVMVTMKQFDAARNMFQQQMDRWGGKVSPALLERLRSSLEGAIALEEGKSSEAVSHLQGLSPSPGQDPPDSEALGRAYLGAKDYARAQGVFQKIVEDPDRFSNPVRFILGLVRLGEALEGDGKNGEAAARYREALKWWGSADWDVPEIVRAREAIKRLGR